MFQKGGGKDFVRTSPRKDLPSHLVFLSVCIARVQSEERRVQFLLTRRGARTAFEFLSVSRRQGGVANRIFWVSFFKMGIFVINFLDFFN